MKQEERDMYAICTASLLTSFFLLILLTSQGNSITGFLILEEKFGTNFTYQQPENVTRELALQSLMKAEDDVKELENFVSSTYYVNDLLIEAKQAYVNVDYDMVIREVRAETDQEKKDYLKNLLDRSLITGEKTELGEVFRLTQLISYTKKKTYTLIDSLALLEEKEAEYKEQGIDTTEVSKLMEEAKKSFDEERYEESENLIREADSKLEASKTEFTRIKRLLKMSKGFFERNWLPILAILLVLAVLTPITINEIKLKIVENKLKMLKLEKETITKLIKKVQDERYNKGKVSASVYNIRMEKYRNTLAEINRTIPVLEAILEKKKKEKKPKKKEKEGIIKIEK